MDASEDRLRELLNSADLDARVQGAVLLETLDDPALDDALYRMLRVRFDQGGLCLQGRWPLARLPDAPPSSLLSRWAQRCTRISAMGRGPARVDGALLCLLPRLEEVKFFGKQIVLDSGGLIYPRLKTLKVNGVTLDMEGLGQVPVLDLKGCRGLERLTGEGTTELLVGRPMPDEWSWVPRSVRRLTVREGFPDLAALPAGLTALLLYSDRALPEGVEGLERFSGLRVLTLALPREQTASVSLPSLGLTRLNLIGVRINPGALRRFTDLRSLLLWRAALVPTGEMVLPDAIESLIVDVLTGAHRIVFPPTSAPQAIQARRVSGGGEIVVHNPRALRKLEVSGAEGGVRLVLHGAAPALESVSIDASVVLDVSQMQDVPPVLR